MIEVARLSKQFGGPETVEALSDVSFSVKRGTGLGVLGPNGAGKTTLLRILSTLLKPTEGKVTVGDSDLLLEPKKVREIIGYVPQTPAFSRNVSVDRYLRFWGRLNGLSRKEREDRIEHLLEDLGLREFASQLVLDIPPLARQRLLLGQALLTNPEILLLDEPMLGLTPGESEEYTRMLHGQLKYGLTVLVTSSVFQEVLPVCTHLVVLSGGHATKAYGTSALLRAVGKARHARVFLKAKALPPEVPQVLRGLKGVLDVKEATTATVLYVEPGSVKKEEVETVLRDAGVKNFQVKIGDITLGDVFRTLYGGE